MGVWQVGGKKCCQQVKTDSQQTRYMYFHVLILKVPKLKIMVFADRADPDDVAHYEPHQLNFPCLPSSL